MSSKFTVSVQRWVALIGFLLYDLTQVWIAGHLIVHPNSHLLFRFTVQWSNTFQLPTSMIILLFILPFVISYVFAVGSISNSDMVQIVGSKSLLKRIQMEFHAGNPEGKEYSKESLEHTLQDMAVGQPDGTYDNLVMLFNVGLLVQELIEKSGIKSIKRVYMSDDLAPNAFTLRVLPLPFLGQDWIIINRNIIDILEASEIKAVVAHEIGHAARKDSWINALLYSPRLVIILGWSVILASMASIILSDLISFDALLRLLTLSIVFIIIRVLMNIGYNFTTYAYKRTELLADHYAAKLVGSEDLVNALIKIGQRAEVIRSVKVELEWVDKKFNEMPIEVMSTRILHFFDPGETDKIKAREFTLRFYIRSKLNQIFSGLRIPIDDETFNKYVQQATESVMNERGIEIDAEKAIDVLGPERMQRYTEDWRNADFDHNNKLDKDEIRALVTEMKTSGKPIFETEALQQMGIIEGTKTHPQVTERITFLHDNLLVD